MALTLSEELTVLSDVLPYLRCPLCRGPLAQPAGAQAVRCPAGHSFDPARAGYLPLTRGPISHPGDTAAMVAARESFLATGGYEFIAAALAQAAAGRAGLVVEVGAGTGYYLARVLARAPGAVGLAVDVAKPALRRAARAHQRAGAVGADAWRGLPIADHAASVILDVFAPRNAAEFARVIAPDGELLVVTPTPGHLRELPGLLGGSAGVRLLGIGPAKPAALTGALERWFRPTGASVHDHRLHLTRPQLQALVLMGPSAAHTDPAALAAAVASLPEPIRLTASVRLSRFVPHPLG